MRKDENDEDLDESWCWNMEVQPVVGGVRLCCLNLRLCLHANRAHYSCFSERLEYSTENDTKRPVLFHKFTFVLSEH